ncbi:pimeloyl-ACP methyl ester carboxylesterase [Paraburkholderia sp. GAS199]
MLKTAANPGGLPMSVFDEIRDGVKNNRSQFFKDLAVPFFGFNRPDAKVSQGTIDWFWFLGMQGSIKGLYDCVKAFSETDFTDDLKKVTVPALVLQGNADQIVPLEDSGALSSKIMPNAKLKIYEGAPHGMCTTHADKVNADLLEFIQS